MSGSSLPLGLSGTGGRGAVPEITPVVKPAVSTASTTALVPVIAILRAILNGLGRTALSRWGRTALITIRWPCLLRRSLNRSRSRLYRPRRYRLGRPLGDWLSGPLNGLLSRPLDNLLSGFLGHGHNRLLRYLRRRNRFSGDRRRLGGSVSKVALVYKEDRDL
jgi:hypothetical protein